MVMKPAVATHWPVLSRLGGRHVGVVLVTEACDLDVEAAVLAVGSRRIGCSPTAPPPSERGIPLRACRSHEASGRSGSQAGRSTDGRGPRMGSGARLSVAVPHCHSWSAPFGLPFESRQA
jgi:hypothetical protein